MVLVQSARLFPAARPNPVRVTGLSMAIVLNVAVLLAASVLMKPPLFLQPASDAIAVVHLPAERTPTPPPPPEVVPVVRRQDAAPAPRPVPEPRASLPDTRAQAIATGPVVDPAPDAFVVPDAGGAPDPAPAGQPVAGVRLEYASAPAPRYSAELVRAGAQGTVLLQVRVGEDGRPLDVVVHRSSGNRRLDRLAQQHVLAHWTFRPAMRDGQPVQAIGLVPIDFRLD